MTFSAPNKLSQSKDISGSTSPTSSLNITEESLSLGSPISGQNGTSASISGSTPNLTISGLTNMSNVSVCRFLTISGAGEGGNNGTFSIVEYIDPTSVIIYNPAGQPGDVNNGNISWVERKVYSLEDDLNYARSDRAAIKGVDYDQLLSQYYRSTDQAIPIDANLANIAGNTTDAIAFVDNVRYYNLSVGAGDAYITLEDIGNLKHADAVDITGVPVDDGYDAGNKEATFVCILDDGYGTEITVLDGYYIGWRVFGRTKSGSSPDSVEIEFMAVKPGSPISSAVDYIWEAGQPTLIHLIIGYRKSLNSLPDTVFRKLMINSIIYGGRGRGSGGASLPDATEIGQILYSVDGISFSPQLPIVNDDGLILVNEQGRIVVVGGS